MVCPDVYECLVYVCVLCMRVCTCVCTCVHARALSTSSVWLPLMVVVVGDVSPGIIIVVVVVVTCSPLRTFRINRPTFGTRPDLFLFIRDMVSRVDLAHVLFRQTCVGICPTANDQHADIEKMVVDCCGQFNSTGGRALVFLW